MPKTYWRPITVEGKTYTWYVTNERDVLVRGPEKGSTKHRFTPEHVVLRREEDKANGERYDYWEERCSLSVGPGEVARFIRETLLGLPPMPERVVTPYQGYVREDKDNPWRMPGGDTGDYAVLMDVHRGDGQPMQTVLVSLHDAPLEAKERAKGLLLETGSFVYAKRHRRLSWKPWMEWKFTGAERSAFEVFKDECLSPLGTDMVLERFEFRAVTARTAADMGLVQVA